MKSVQVVFFCTITVVQTGTATGFTRTHTLLKRHDWSYLNLNSEYQQQQMSYDEESLMINMQINYELWYRGPRLQNSCTSSPVMIICFIYQCTHTLTHTHRRVSHRSAWCSSQLRVVPSISRSVCVCVCVRDQTVCIGPVDEEELKWEENVAALRRDAPDSSASTPIHCSSRERRDAWRHGGDAAHTIIWIIYDTYTNRNGLILNLTLYYLKFNLSIIPRP